ncbi:putative LysR family transcriptional regulator [Streptomyces sp. NBRC 110611]|uniref:LysR family transcriptional regulator n=1 Tax=Streptomyces sp. NBRC 110611 TaxID=1621259 RepID=UPI0008309B97|nr:LysR family transcriptional regulator [Streptomyces sp. NBRC 110611]GAU67837.1 putative LysR family transcriptional regulator [Streptomyces sp. NBRC 110611]
MYRNLDVGQLRTLITIMRTGGFRRAAEALSLTQPAVSQHIRRLEAVLGGPVFASTGRRLELSGAGRELYHYACRIVALNDEAADRITAAGQQTCLRIGVSPYLEGALPGLLSAFASLMPWIRPTVHTGLSESLADRVADGDIDVGLLLRPSGDPHSEPVGTLPLAWYGPIPSSTPTPTPTSAPTSASAPASTPTPTSSSARSVPIALCGEPCNLRRHILGALTAHDRPWHLAYEGPDVTGLRAAVAAGLGVTCLPAAGLDARGVQRLPAEALPTPEPLTVSLSVAPRVGATTAEAAFFAAQQALRPYLTADPAPAVRTPAIQTPAVQPEAPPLRNRRRGGALAGTASARNG